MGHSFKHASAQACYCIDKDVGCNVIVPHARLFVINSIMTLVAGVIH